MNEIYDLVLPNDWIGAARFESILKRTGNPHKSPVIQIRVPVKCRIMVDAGIRLLSLINQLSSECCSVKVIFEGENNDAWGYLTRANFFAELSPLVNVEPIPLPNLFPEGSNSNLVEFKRIDPKGDSSKDTTAKTLIKSLGSSLKPEQTKNSLLTAAGTIFSELIQNIYDHSKAPIDGYAALQVYGKAKKVQVVVSDSGLGLLNTLRPTLTFTKYDGLSDTDLITAIFTEGLSSKGPDRGNGIKACADFAWRLKAPIELRLPNSSISFRPTTNGFQAVNAALTSNLPLLWGTHFSFSFPLDN
jgi:hypothetical protein